MLKIEAEAADDDDHDQRDDGDTQSGERRRTSRRLRQRPLLIVSKVCRDHLAITGHLRLTEDVLAICFESGPKGLGSARRVKRAVEQTKIPSTAHTVTVVATSGDARPAERVRGSHLAGVCGSAKRRPPPPE